MSKSKVVTIPACFEQHLSDFPKTGQYPVINGMRKLYGWGENGHTIVKCGCYAYNVPKEKLQSIPLYVF